MGELPAGHVRHLTTGRVRIKIPARRGDEAFFQTVEARLADWEHVEQVATNPITGSVLVHFSDLPGLFFENAAKNDLFEVDFDLPETGPDAESPLTAWAAERVAAADNAVQRWTAGAGDIRGIVFLLLVAGAGWQMLRGNIAAPAATLLWYAGAMLRLWDTPPVNEPGNSPGGRT